MTIPDHGDHADRATPASDARESAWDVLPESTLELHQGRLLVGTSLIGSRALLATLLQDLGVAAALALAPLDTWWDALTAAAQPRHLTSAQAWMAWAAQAPSPAPIAAAGPHSTWMHAQVADQLRTSLYHATRAGALAVSLGPDVVMRLGDQGWTPDILLIGTHQLHRLHAMYLDGPADLVIEITMPGHEQDETVLRRRAYATGGVPEYAIVDPVARTMTFLRLVDGRYQPQPLDADGRYQPASLPGLVCVPTRLWDARSQPDQRWIAGDCGVFAVAPGAPANDGIHRSWRAGIATDAEVALPFAPVIGRQPRPITFDQYIAWCPEARFEWIGGRITIGHRHGTRNVLRLLLLTFGLDAALTVLPMQTWVAGILAEAERQQHAAGQRDAWWTFARAAATRLRVQHSIRQVAVIGDLAQSTPLHSWSTITLVVWGMPADRSAIHRTLRQVGDDPSIELIDATTADRFQHALITRTAVLLDDD